MLFFIYFNADGVSALLDGIGYFASQTTVLYVAMIARATSRHFLKWDETNCDNLASRGS